MEIMLTLSVACEHGTLFCLIENNEDIIITQCMVIKTYMKTKRSRNAWQSKIIVHYTQLWFLMTPGQNYRTLFLNMRNFQVRHLDIQIVKKWHIVIRQVLSSFAIPGWCEFADGQVANGCLPKMRKDERHPGWP